MADPLPFLGATGPALRRSVVDPETGNVMLGPQTPAGALDYLGAYADLVGGRIRDAATAPNRTYRGEIPIFDPATGHVSDEAMDAGAGIAGLAMTGSLPFPVPAGALRVFGGRSSRTADQDALREAQGLAGQGVDRKIIWDDTGWFQGAGGEWRYEIPDQATRYSGHGSALGHGLDHPKAYQAYPSLRAVGHEIKSTLPNDAWGMYYYRHAGDPDRIEIARSSLGEAVAPAKMHDTALHEMQHAIQAREGAMQGSASQNLTVQDYIADLRQKMTNGYKLTGKEADPAAFQRWKDLRYWTNPIEVEARNVERRRTWSDAERRSVPPWESADVPWPQFSADQAQLSPVLSPLGTR